MSVILSVDSYTLVKTGDHLIPFAWYQDFGDGPVYIHGSESREKAEKWAIKEEIMPELDPQGDL